MRTFVPLVLILAVAATSTRAQQPTSSKPRREAISSALQIVQKAAANYPNHRKCFSCHHQTLPMLAMVSARRYGLEIDEKLLQAQADFTHKTFAARSDSLRQGKRIGGAAMTVGYGLWALALADRGKDDTTEAMVEYLLHLQHDDGHWSRTSLRPPLEQSHLSCSVLSMHFIQKFADQAQRQRVESALEKGTLWLAGAEAVSQEDKNARLLGLSLWGDGDDLLSAARQAVLDAQREDGGWAQLDEMSSDAYATGQTLYVLHATGTTGDENTGDGITGDGAAHRRGVQFLLDTQQDDGSWFVATRSKPVQTFFDNGDPHGKNQFISTPATCWALVALTAGEDR